MDSEAISWPWAPYKALAIEAECYETPEWAVEAILEREIMTGLVIDPCCGRGVLAEAAAERGHRVDAFDLYDWGYGRAGVDFLAWHFAESAQGIGERDEPAGWTCLMNPPFTQAAAFVEHAFAEGAQKVMLFQRLALWESHHRRAFWAAHPPSRIYVCESPAECWRVDIAPAARRGGTRTPHAWFVFERRHPAGTLIARLARPARAGQGDDA
jgi:predicted RNA methylase